MIGPPLVWRQDPGGALRLLPDLPAIELRYYRICAKVRTWEWMVQPVPGTKTLDMRGMALSTTPPPSWLELFSGMMTGVTHVPEKPFDALAVMLHKGISEELVADHARRRARVEGGRSTAAGRRAESARAASDIARIRENGPGISLRAAVRVYLKRNDPSWEGGPDAERERSVAALLRRVRRTLHPKNSGQ